MKFKQTVNQDIDELRKRRTDSTITLSDNIDPNKNAYKVGRTFWINKVLDKRLDEEFGKSQKSKAIDRILSEYFGISYAEAYGRKALRQGGREILWEITRDDEDADR